MGNARSCRRQRRLIRGGKPEGTPKIEQNGSPSRCEKSRLLVFSGLIPSLGPTWCFARDRNWEIPARPGSRLSGQLSPIPSLLWGLVFPSRHDYPTWPDSREPFPWQGWCPAAKRKGQNPQCTGAAINSPHGLHRVNKTL